jgi:hypothetical protein
MLHPASNEQPTPLGSQQPYLVLDLEAPDDLARQIYCILGLPIDAVEMMDVLQRIEGAAASTTPFLISTVNVNFLAISQTDTAFKDSILRSDLCIVDGMPVVWIARLMGLLIRRRVAGSDVFAAMKSRPSARNLKLFLFGGDEGVADAAARTINQRTARMQCVGSIYPGLATSTRCLEPKSSTKSTPATQISSSLLWGPKRANTGWRATSRFFGLLLMLRKQLEASGRRLVFTGVSSRIARLFRRNGVAFLLSHELGV